MADARQAKFRARVQRRKMMLAQQRAKAWMEKCVRIFTGIAATRWSEEVAIPLRCCCRRMAKGFDMHSPVSIRNAAIAFHDLYLLRSLMQPLTPALKSGLSILSHKNAKELWSQGFTVVPQFASLQTIQKVVEFVKENDGYFFWQHPLNPRTYRDDKICWVDPRDAKLQQQPFLDYMARFSLLRDDLAKLVAIGHETEHQLAKYAANSLGYTRHVDADAADSLKGDRRVSAVSYLNLGWCSEHGGALRIWPPRVHHPPIEVHPHAGVLALFMSGAIPHQVKRTTKARMAFTTWFH